MAKHLRPVLLIILSMAIIASAGVMVWLKFDARVPVYTDAETIRDPVRSAPVRDILWTPSRSLSSVINSAGDDYEPRVSADGLTLFFVRGRPGENADIFTSTKTPAGWGEPTSLVAINSGADDLGPELAPDGQSLYFYSNRAGGFGGYDLWVAHRSSNGGWLAPINLGPGVNTPFNEYGVALASKTNTLYFASNRPRENDIDSRDPDAWPATIREDIYQRDYDLYQAQITDAGVLAPISLDALNTRWNEGSPAVSPFNDYLYFASDRDGGEGGFDLYRTRQLRGGHEPPTNLGRAVNTPANELDPALSMGGYELHFASDRSTAQSSASPTDSLATDSASAGAPQQTNDDDYNLYRTTSREVFIETDIAKASIDWSALAPWLLLPLLLLLLLLLTLSARRLANSDRLRKLSLLAKCILASLLIHMLLLLAFTAWQVTTHFGDIIKRSGGTRVTLSSVGTSNDVASQIRASAIDGAILETELPTLESVQAKMLVGESTPMERVDMDADAASLSQPQQIAADMALSDSPTPVPTQPTREPQAPISPDIPVQQTTIATPAAAPARAKTEPTQREPMHMPLTEIARKSVPQPLQMSMSDLLQTTPTFTSSDGITLPSESIAKIDMSDAATTVDPAAPVALSDSSLPSIPPMASVEAPVPASAARMTESEATLTIAPPQSAALTERANIGLNSNDTLISALSPILIDVDSASLEVPTVDLAAPITSMVDSPARTSILQPQLPAPAHIAVAMPSDALSDVDRLPQSADVNRVDEEANHIDATLSAVKSVPSASHANIENTPQLPLDSASATEAPHIATDRATSESIASVMRPKPSESSITAAKSTQEHPVLSVDIPSVSLALLPDLRLPSEIDPAPDVYPQRDPAQRQELVEEHGGSRETEKAVAVALDWLARHQSADGRWSSREFDDDCGQCRGKASTDVDVALTGLATLCFLGADYTHAKESEHRLVVQRAVDYLLSVQSKTGDLRAGETMYSHGIASIVLCEAYGMTGDASLREPAQRAIDFISRSRHRAQGGWRYEPGMAGDTSVLGWQVMALASAKRVGLIVDDEVFATAKAWLDRASRRQAPGLYSYQPGMPHTRSMTAEGMFVQQLLGRARDEPRMAQSAAFLVRKLPDWSQGANTYLWYYATLALFQHQGDAWRQWNEALTVELLGRQRDDGLASGSWDPADRWSHIGGRVYQTALCTLSLEVYYRYLPLYMKPKRAPAPDGVTGVE